MLQDKHQCTDVLLSYPAVIMPAAMITLAAVIMPDFPSWLTAVLPEAEMPACSGMCCGRCSQHPNPVCACHIAKQLPSNSSEYMHTFARIIALMADEKRQS